MFVLTGKQIRTAEQNAVDMGMNWLRLMENAGSAAAREIRQNYTLDGRKVVIVCGKGNNGGDGYVIARKLLEDNASVRIISVGVPSTESACEMASKAFNLGLRPIDFESYETLCNKYISDADIVVDAVFGTGFKGEPSGIYAAAINAINTSKSIKIAIDIPSGLDSDSGVISGVSVKCDMTVTFASYKPCHLLYPSSENCGKVIVTSIGMPDEAFSDIQPVMQVVTEAYTASLLPTRGINCHKGLCGTAGLFVGSKGYSGAALIAGKAAVKSGAGIVNMIIPESIYTIIGCSLPEAVCTVLDGENNNTININNVFKTVDALNNCTCGLIGCGLGQSESVKYAVSETLKKCNVPLVIDADGINIISNCIDLVRQYKSSVIITPHPKEASRILKCSVEDIQSDRLGSATKLCRVTNATVILKGAKTIISCPNGSVYIVTDGNPGMATAGTGDMLAGMCVAFLAQGLSAEEAAVCSVKIHALSGDTAVKDTSILSLTPTDMINTLNKIYCQIYSLK